jgi:tRNA threonylcarbamoyladenosine biosynthesis protein TsaB
MRILAVDTSTTTASVALISNSDVVAEIFMNLGVNHSCILLPAVEEICNMSRLELKDMDLFVCTIGPGSFTGVRIGLSTVKGFALSTGKPVVAVSTLEALALNLSGSPYMVCPMLDARKQHVYTALYRMDDQQGLEVITDERDTEINLFLQSVKDEVICVGEGAVKYAGIIREVLQHKVSFAAGIHNHVRASTAGLLGEKKFLKGEQADFVHLVPKYLRLSEAEIRMK